MLKVGDFLNFLDPSFLGPTPPGSIKTALFCPPPFVLFARIETTRELPQTELFHFRKERGG